MSCNFNLDFPDDSMVVSSDTDASADPLTLNWYFGFNSFSYGARNGGGCSFSGPHPPEISSSDYSPGLFVSSINDESSLLEPPGITTAPRSSFDGDVSLSFAAPHPDSSEDGSSLNASWQMTYSLRRRCTTLFKRG